MVNALVELCRRDLQISTLFKILTLIVLFYIKNQIVFQTKITEIDKFEKIIGIANVNCLSQAFTAFLSEFTVKIEFYH